MVQGIIKQVAHLWHAHSVPLKLRARFWTGFHAREDYFFAAELRRLRHLDQRLREASSRLLLIQAGNEISYAV